MSGPGGAAELAAWADTDPKLRELLDLLPEKWAATPADDDGEDCALIFARAAYAAGYTRGLEERP